MTFPILSTESLAKRKINYPLIFLSCLILTLSAWNFWCAEEEFKGKDLRGSVLPSWALQDFTSNPCSNDQKESMGVVVLGMHRSGTSMLTGLLATAYGYYTGEDEELIPPRYANAKGYFERFDIVRQNDRFLQEARKTMPWFNGNILFTPLVIVGYNADSQEMVNKTFDPDLTTAINFLNNRHAIPPNHTTIPWILKDPRMCITLRTWLPLIESPPAALITYRHPAEVAHSVASRDRKPMLIGLKAWIAYNAALVRNSMGLCRVITKNSDLLFTPQTEIRRIVDELQTKCKVVPPPIAEADPAVVNEFIDVKMQGSRHAELTPCVDGKPYFNVTTTGLKPTSRKFYKKAMELFCDMESGIAFLPNYTGWPTEY